jgi:hypothetical protein
VEGLFLATPCDTRSEYACVVLHTEYGIHASTVRIFSLRHCLPFPLLGAVALFAKADETSETSETSPPGTFNLA